MLSCASVDLGVLHEEISKPQPERKVEIIRKFIWYLKGENMQKSIKKNMDFSGFYSWRL